MSVDYIRHGGSGLPLCRKDKPIGQVFGSGFSLDEAIDAAADVYNGVRLSHLIICMVTDTEIVRLLVHTYISGAFCVV